MDQYTHIFPVVMMIVTFLLILSGPIVGSRPFGSAKMYWIVLSILSFLTMIAWGSRVALNISMKSSLITCIIWLGVTLASLFFARKAAKSIVKK